MKRKEERLYNMIMPFWLLMLMPFMWIIVIPANFIIDLLVLSVAMKIFKVPNIFENLKKSFLKTWLLGFAADFIGCVPLLVIWQLPVMGTDNVIGRLRDGVMFNPFRSVESFIFVLLCVVLAAVFIFYFNYKIALKKTGLTVVQKKKVALAMAIATAPYLFFVPAI